MDKTVNGHITLDTYLVFDKAEVTSENHSLVNGKIDIDEYIYQFDKDLWGVSDAHAQAERDLDKYLDALIAYTKNIIEHMFDSCTFDVTKTSYTSNIIVTPDGVARVFAEVDIEFDGTNPRLQKSELGAEMKKRLQERHSEGLAGIADVVYPGYEFWFDKCGDIYASCTSLISADVFAAASANVDDFKLYKALDGAMSRALKDAGLGDKIT